MAQKGLKSCTGVMTKNGVTYGPYEFSTFSGGKRTRTAIKKRKGAGKQRKVRKGSADVETGTVTIEVDNSIDLNMLWDLAGRWTITVVPADDDGNALEKNRVTRTGIQIGLEDGDADIEDDEDIDMATLEFAFDSLTSS